MLYKFRQIPASKKIGISSVDNPNQFLFSFKEPSTFAVEGKVYKSSCVGCLNPACMKFFSEELNLQTAELNGLTFDPEDTVCPVDAINWERGARTPSIISEICINCGICIRRCPFGAIYSDGKKAVIHLDEPHISFESLSPQNLEKHKNQLTSARNARHLGHYIDPSECQLKVVYNKISSIQLTQFPNLFIRNLFLVLGNKCVMRRRGDVYFRIDVIIEDESQFIGILEVEFGADSLESPRAVLDDFSVISSRYNVPKEKIKPYIVFLEFPNRRAEYWQVIKDINNVLEIKINSLTLGSLLLLLWKHCFISFSQIESYADVDFPSIRENISQLSESDNLPEFNNLAILEPIK